MDAVTLVDLVLAVLAIEATALAWATGRDRRGPRVAAWLPNLGAGFCLVLALGSVARGQSVVVLGALLALAGACHAMDLSGRLKR